MRCPKCGYISFDHVDTCLKCNKDISAISSKVAGTTYNVAPPSFLRFTKGESVEKKGEEISFDPDQDDYGTVDPDLDVLVDDDAEGEDDGATISFGDDFEVFGGLADEENSKVADSDDDSDIDLGQFEDAFEEEEVGGDEEELALEFPDELSDLSDLSGPAGDGEDEPGGGPAFTSTEEKGDSDDFSLDLDLDGLDDDFSLTIEEETEQQGDADDLGDLSLDDLGLSDEPESEAAAEPAPAKKKVKDDMDMDGELDFDLDLGGISLDNDD